jgi:hypothetical protein
MFLGSNCTYTPTLLKLHITMLITQERMILHLIDQSIENIFFEDPNTFHR